MSTAVDQLIILIDQLKETANDLKVNNQPALNKQLHESIDPIAKKMGTGGYIDLSHKFTKLIDNTKEDLERSPRIKEAVKERYRKAISNIENVFMARNFAALTSSVFSKHFSTQSIDMLYAFSDRIEREGKQSADIDTLKAALRDTDSAISDFCKLNSIPEPIKAALRAHLKSLQDAIDNYDIFGEGDFWDRYGLILSNMSSLYPDLSETERKQMSNHSGKLFKWYRTHLGIGSDIATIGMAVMTALPKA